MSFLTAVGFTVAAVGLSATVLNAGVAAAADDYTGLTFSQASAAAGQRGATPIIATVSGDKLATDDCIVTSWRKSMFLDSSQNGTGRTGEILLNLNCNAAVASAGVPGNSAATPQGRAAKKDDSDAEYINEHQDECYKDDDTLAYCQKICEKTGKCEL